MVNREEAKRIAEDFLRAKLPGETFHIREVYDYFEYPWTLERIYEYQETPWTTCWIVYYVEACDQLLLRSSTIVVLSKENGKVFYRGSTGDEG